MNWVHFMIAYFMAPLKVINIFKKITYNSNFNNPIKNSVLKTCYSIFFNTKSDTYNGFYKLYNKYVSTTEENVKQFYFELCFSENGI